MTTSTKPKQSLAGIELVRLLTYEGDRIFTTDRARELAPRVGLKDSYLTEALYHLRRNDWIVPLRRGLYALSSTVPGVSDAHEFEVAMALVSPAGHLTLVGPALPRPDRTGAQGGVRSHNDGELGSSNPEN